MAQQRMLAIVGPTASGKSQVAMAVAERIGGEIVSCDSVQVYRGFEIGCAKPSARARARVAHHLIDIVEWHEPFDAQQYRTLAREAVEEIQRRRKAAILCGGTGLYLRALRWGLVDTPPADPSLRQRLADEERAEPGLLYARLHATDPQSAQRIEPNNLVQVIRALEIQALTGEPASVVRGRHGFGSEEMPMHVVTLIWDTPRLRERISRRCHAMVERGLLDEVEGLLASGVDPGARPMTAVGYREACAVVQGNEPAEGLVERIAHSTRRYAKRQRTWFRKERNVTWLTVGSLDDATERVAALVDAPG